MSQKHQTDLAKLELPHLETIETAFVHSWNCRLLSQVQEIVLHKMRCTHSKAMFTLSVFEIDNRTGVSLKISHSHSSLQMCLEYCLYERATGVKPIFLTSNHSHSDQTKIKDGDVYKTERVQSSSEFCHHIFINRRQLLNLDGEQSIWIARTRAEHNTYGRTSVGKLKKIQNDTLLISPSL